VRTTLDPKCSAGAQVADDGLVKFDENRATVGAITKTTSSAIGRQAARVKALADNRAVAAGGSARCRGPVGPHRLSSPAGPERHRRARARNRNVTLEGEWAKRLMSDQRPGADQSHAGA